MDWYLYSETEISDGSEVKTYKVHDNDDIEVTIKIEKKMVKKPIDDSSNFNIKIELHPIYIVNNGEESTTYSTKEEAFEAAEKLLIKD